MSRRSPILGWVVLSIVGIALAYAGYRMRAPEEVCDVCQRHLHSETRTVGLLGADKEVFCCPTCALTAHFQSGKAMKIVSLSDHETRRELKPENAWVVEGSDLNYCVRQHMLMDEHKHATPMDFDRCSPSMIAFAGRPGAERFLARHGGRLVRFGELAASYGR